VVIAVTPLHERQVLLLRAADGTELVASIAGAPPAAGSEVTVTIASGRALLFDAASGQALHAPRALAEIAA
jgi:multiple sugar transport system ATP-binding protein